MNMKDVYNHTSASLVTGPSVLTASTTPAAIDLQGFQSALIAVGAGIGGITFDATNKVTIVVTHSDDDSTYTAVTDAHIKGVTGITSGIIKSFVAAHAAAAVYLYGYHGGKRYLKVQVAFAGTHGAGTPFQAVVYKSNPTIVPIV